MKWKDNTRNMLQFITLFIRMICMVQDHRDVSRALHSSRSKVCVTMETHLHRVRAWSGARSRSR